MNITVHNPSTIPAIENLLRNNSFFPISKSSVASVHFRKKYVTMAPFALAMIAAWAQECKKSNTKINCYIDSADSKRVLTYAWRMKLMDFMTVSYNPGYTKHEESGRFVPLTEIKTSEDLDRFLSDVVPLLHLARKPNAAHAVKYCLSEAIRNVLEHAGNPANPIPAYVCAQYYKHAKKISIGIADCGKGVFTSLKRRYPDIFTHSEAIAEALKPGISAGTTKDNAGAGLYFIRSICKSAGSYFAIYSGDACYRLRRKRHCDGDELFADPLMDRHDLYMALPFWQGTVIAIDINLEGTEAFEKLLDEIRRTFFENRVKKDYSQKVKFT